MSKYNLWVKCEEHKRSMKFLNDKLLKNQEFKGQPQDTIEVPQTNLEMDMIGRYMFMMRTPMPVISVEKLDT